MNISTIVKLVMFIIVFSVIFIFCMTLGSKIEPVGGAIFGGVVGLGIILSIMMWLYPIVFKDYIDEFNAKQEKKKCLEEGQENQFTE